MGNLSGKINLTGFNKAFTETRKDQAGNDVPCVVIPMPHNWLEKTEKGNVFANFFGNEIPAEKRKANRKDTHIVNMDPGKEARQKLKEMGEYPPTLGNIVDWGQVSPQEPQANDSPAQAGFSAPSSDPAPF